MKNKSMVFAIALIVVALCQIILIGKAYSNKADNGLVYADTNTMEIVTGESIETEQLEANSQQDSGQQIDYANSLQHKVLSNVRILLIGVCVIVITCQAIVAFKGTNVNIDDLEKKDIQDLKDIQEEVKQKQELLDTLKSAIDTGKLDKNDVLSLIKENESIGQDIDTEKESIIQDTEKKWLFRQQQHQQER